MHHGSHVPPGPDGALGLTAWLTGIYFVIEFAIGIYTGSVSVLSDAFHTFSAVGGVILALVAARIARRKATPERSFGYGRAEIIGALLNGVFLFLMALVVLWMGYMRLRQPIDLPTMPMLIAAFGGLIVEVIALRALYASQKGDLNIRGAFWHVLQTFVGSLIIIIAVVVIELTGFLAIDPILGMVFGLILLIASWSIIRESLVVLLRARPQTLISMKLAGQCWTSMVCLTSITSMHGRLHPANMFSLRIYASRMTFPMTPFWPRRIDT